MMIFGLSARPRDADALTLAARELVWVALRRVGLEPNRAEQLQNRLLAAGAVADPVDLQRLGDDGADLERGIEGGERILQDDLHLARMARSAR